MTVAPAFVVVIPPAVRVSVPPAGTVVEEAANEPICTGDGDADDPRNRVRAKLSRPRLESLTFPTTTARPSAWSATADGRESYPSQAAAAPVPDGP